MTDATRIQDALRAMAADGREAVRVPPFTLLLDPHTPLTFLNFAVPDAGAAAWPDAAIEALCAACDSRGRVPRFELVEDCWPGLVDALERHEFAVELRTPGMTCAPGALADAPLPAGVVLEPVERDAPEGVVREYLDLGLALFAAPGDTWEPPGAASVATFREHGAEGVAARDVATGAMVGRAAWIGPRLGVAEVVGVAVVPGQRRRGIAGAMTAAVTRMAFAAGAELAFLTPGDEGAARVYARAGFEPGVRCVHLARTAE